MQIWRFGILTKEVDVIVPILVGAVAIIVGVGVGYFVRKNISEAKIGDAEKRAQEILDKANLS